jgi:Na+/H+ antiporter NhaA
MSLFVAGLAFSQTELLDPAKVGILAGSALAGITGSLILSRASVTTRTLDTNLKKNGRD